MLMPPIVLLDKLTHKKGRCNYTKHSGYKFNEWNPIGPLEAMQVKNLPDCYLRTLVDLAPKLSRKMVLSS